MKNKKRQSNHKAPIIMLVLVTVLAAAIVFYFLLVANRPKDDPLSSIDSSINYKSPTEAEIDAGEHVKKANEDKNGAQIIQDYSVEISRIEQFAQNIEIKAFITGLIKDGGTCTFTFTKDSYLITKTSDGSADAAYTNCALLQVPISEFPAIGTWSLVVSYSFADITINSLTRNLEVAK